MCQVVHGFSFVTNLKCESFLANRSIILKGNNTKNNAIQTVNKAINFNPNNGVVVLIDHTSSVLLLGTDIKHNFCI